MLAKDNDAKEVCRKLSVRRGFSLCVPTQRLNPNLREHPLKNLTPFLLEST